MGRRIYLKKMTVEAATLAWDKALAGAEWKIDGTERLETGRAAGRITASAVTAMANAPSFASCAMDGIAVRAGLTFGAGPSSPLELDKDSFVDVNTGNPLPRGLDAVIKEEELNRRDNGSVVIHKPATPWQHVRKIGENAVKGTMLLPSNALITPQAAALMLSAGVLTVKVRRRLRVAVIPTGDELCPPDKPATGKVPEYNSTMIKGCLEDWGCEVTVFPIVRDSAGAIGATLDEALSNHDLVVLNAGSSAGSKDFAADVVQSRGDLVVHGVEIRPGKPLLLGLVRGKPVAGLPGYPVAALVDLECFVKPLVYKASGRSSHACRTMTARAARTITSQLGDKEIIYGKLVRINGDTIFHPLPRGSASLASAVRADARAMLPPSREGVVEGEQLRVELCRPGLDLDSSLLAVGSHDLLLFVIQDMLADADEPIHFDSIHVGSMGGMRAMARRQAHLAGVHLLDPDTKTYNTPFLDKFLPSASFGLMRLCRREQGLVVARGNPRSIKDLSCLGRSDILFVNRQQGSGTRILLDLKLKELGLSRDDVRGYNNEENNHISVAVRVANGFADCGLAVRAAANALGLDFIPIEQEEYDLLLDRTFLESPASGPFFDIISSTRFRKAALELGGYDLGECGKMLVRPK